LAGYTVKKIDEMEGTFLGGFKLARAELGVEAFGMQVLDIPAGWEDYPDHDHADDGQEEVYVALRGDAQIEIDGERHPLDGDHMVSVKPGVRRKVHPGAQGIRMLVIGGVAGRAYEPPERTKLGAPDPLRQS
jgi:mannose-6-phosphate isomerase-like protein (cupin superfamily)